MKFSFQKKIIELFKRSMYKTFFAKKLNFKKKNKNNLRLKNPFKIKFIHTHVCEVGAYYSFDANLVFMLMS